jgi:hypothetical protein
MESRSSGIFAGSELSGMRNRSLEAVGPLRHDGRPHCHDTLWSVDVTDSSHWLTAF